EALPSIGATARLRVQSSLKDSEDSWQIFVDNGIIEKVKPSATNVGTIVEVRDLFFATPARLKFLKSDRIESQSILDIFKRMALVNPEIDFSLTDLSNPAKSKLIADYKSYSRNYMNLELPNDISGKANSQRVRQVFGEEIFENLLTISFSSPEMNISGHVSLPTYSRSNSSHQYFFVNGRPIWDKQLLGALRASYSDFIMRGRYPVALIYIDCPPDLVDSNVHPAKTEVRFQDHSFVRNAIVSTIRKTIANANTRTSTAVSEKMMEAFRSKIDNSELGGNLYRGYRKENANLTSVNEPYYENGLLQDISSRNFQNDSTGSVEVSGIKEHCHEKDNELPLGSPVAHVHQNYIISQTSNGLVIIDQHAAHERIVYEELKAFWRKATVASQALLIPEIVELGDERTSILIEFKKDLENLGVVVEQFGNKSICLRSLPAILGQVNGRILLNDLADELLEQKDISVLEEKIEGIISRIACHGSVRSGRKLNGNEMSALLRKMEGTPYSNQCNHGRPTFIELKLTEIEKLFERN
ncbi:MAG: DNA mismatch repair endonuclease MutL, partial [Pseudomonadota bacterium]|nr:DNA mismatch repair endonuclease MutL [Pseudomonadota bacterium]